MILFVSFAGSGYMLFAQYSYDFSSFITTLESLFGMLIGKFDPSIVASANRYGTLCISMDVYLLSD